MNGGSRHTVAPSDEPIEIAGAGLSGLAAAITLTHRGRRVVVHERGRDAGSRFHEDFQGLENWTSATDALDELAGLGIEPDFEHTPFREVAVFGSSGKSYRFTAERPIFYLVRRGIEPGTLDQALKAQALAAGVEIRFGSKVRHLRGGGVAADGPHRADIFSALFLGEPARRSYIVIFAVAIAGVVIAKPLAGGHMAGNLVALGDGAIYAAMVTYMRHEGKTETGNDIAWSMLVGALLLSPAVLVFGPDALTATIDYPAIGMALPVLLWAVCLGVVSTGFAYFGISIVLKTLSANVYALVDIIVSPVVASILGYLVFDEVPARGMIVGGAMLLGAGFWLTREMSRGVGRCAVHACQCA